MNKNLLNSIEFISALQFEAGYAGHIKGGHLPLYFDHEKKRRLVDPVNFITGREKRDLITSIYIAKN